jgi:hemerythrin-like domain-containing protein
MKRSQINFRGGVSRKKSTGRDLTVRSVGQPIPTITQALSLEHKILWQVFDQIEKILSRSQSVPAVKALALMVEGLLSNHGESEINLAYSVLDHVLVERGASSYLYQDHQELDGHFARIQRTNDPAKASGLLKKALAATREHFQREEKTVFPALKQTLQPETLWLLGNQWQKGNSVR